ncbi:aldehyde dehydrogenase family protein [Prochlorococcus sp. MIT 1300]|uniref:aldehyde dehydrogenase family protein n=1 Tax=Prochlorococcus sp. MIT 1300 TaxID=3096218 RepID=UPI002A74A2F1|nr:aldehyde dehydrogenase family protein [Prochlorococcus sp. MIT 1300]
MNPKNFFSTSLRETVWSGTTRPEGWRRKQLDQLNRLIDQNEKEILNALEVDLGKPQTEALFEIIALKQELKTTQKNLSDWIKPRRVQVPLSLKPGEAIVRPEPLGCVLIIGPWNYPFSLTLQPLVSALAAGNTAVLKPSEQSPATSELIGTLIPKYFSKEIIKVVQGGADIAAQLLEEKFDHIFFTGGGAIGKKVMAAAAKNLTPTTLELGGQSPAIVIEGADLQVTAKRLTWGKGLNAGQTCIAPNHLLVEENLTDPLEELMKDSIAKYYGSNPVNSPHLARIVNNYHFNRLNKLLEGARENGQILIGGEVDKSMNKIAPTLIKVENQEDPLMSEEIFGPLLPIIKVKNLEDALRRIRRQPKPLALYMFGGTIREQQILLETTSSGGVCFNDVVMQAGIPDLPFGGVGPSGMGTYHGKAGFNTFSHQKSVLKRPFWLDLKLRYPPYQLDLGLLKRLLG